MSDAPTPMLAQYLALKRDAGDALLFYRMGDFYELFFADAAAAAAALGIALTRRGKYQGEDIPMCGVPVHAADAYLARLVRAGHRVAIAEQMEAPGEARRAGRPVDRAIVRVVTPGTLTEEALLDARQANWLMAIARDGARAGLAWADVSTGRFLTAPVADADAEAALRAAVAPAELVVAEGDPTAGASAFAAAHFGEETARALLGATFGVLTLDAFGAFQPLEIRAAGALVAWLSRMGRGALPRLDPPARALAERYMVVDAATRMSLGLGPGGLVAATDRTRSAPGARLLAEDIARPLVDGPALAARHDAVAWFMLDARRRGRARDLLRATPDFARALGRVGAGRGAPRDLALIGQGLARAGELAALVASGANVGGAEVPALLVDAAARLGAPRALAVRIAAMLGAAPAGSLDEGGYVVAGFDAELDALRDAASGARGRIAALEARYRLESGIAALRIRHNGTIGWHIEAPARAEAALRAAGFAHRQSLAGQVRFQSDALAGLAVEIAAAGEAATKRERAHFDALAADVLADGGAVAAAADALARVDVSAAWADLAAAERWTRPTMTDGTDFAVEGGRHPVVEAALAAARKPFVANDCDLSEKPVWLVTGPNMGGKSTFLRQNALIAVIAQAGGFVPARSATLGIVDRLFSRVGASDDLASGRSTFMVEMVETAHILRHATAQSLVILDEVGRGTATYDGLAIAWAVLEWLHDRCGCRCLFATHYHELTRLAARMEGLHLATLRAREWKGDLVFLHEVAAGAADRSYGLAVARLAGVPGPVVARARAVLARLEAGRPVSVEGELPLFAGEAAVQKEDAVRARLRAVDVDALSPREAWEMVRALAEAVAGEE